MSKEIKLCACGCGEYASPGKTWIRGHRARIQSEEQRQASSEQMKKRMQDPEYAEKMKNILRQRKGENHPLYGKNHSEETRQKMSEAALKRPPRSEETRKKISENNKRIWAGDSEAKQKWLKRLMDFNLSCNGKNLTEETKQKMVESRKKNSAIEKSEEKFSVFADICKLKETYNFSFKTKISSEAAKEYIKEVLKSLDGKYGSYCEIWKDIEYKNDIRERDGNKCNNPLCNCIEYDRLSIHHIDYDKFNCHPHNLITVCVSCNSRANSNRDFWEQHYKEIMESRFDNYYFVETN